MYKLKYWYSHIKSFEYLINQIINWSFFPLVWFNSNENIIKKVIKTQHFQWFHSYTHKTGPCSTGCLHSPAQMIDELCCLFFFLLCFRILSKSGMWKSVDMPLEWMPLWAQASVWVFSSALLPPWQVFLPVKFSSSTHCTGGSDR